MFRFEKNNDFVKFQLPIRGLKLLSTASGVLIVVVGVMYGVTRAKKPQRQVILQPEKMERLHGKPLLEKMQKGGLLLYVRHFHTDHSHWHVDPIKQIHHTMDLAEFSSCKQQRRLTEYGKFRAKLVGKMFRKYKIPIGEVYASPYCRTANSAEHLFGKKPKIRKELLYRNNTYSTDESIADLLGFFKKSEEGTNTVLVAHRTQMDDVSYIQEGEIFVFKILDRKKYALIGKILSQDWVEAQVDINLFGMAGARGKYYR